MGIKFEVLYSFSLGRGLGRGVVRAKLRTLPYPLPKGGENQYYHEPEIVSSIPHRRQIKACREESFQLASGKPEFTFCSECVLELGVRWIWRSASSALQCLQSQP